MQKYRTLKSIFHAGDDKTARAELTRRREDYAAILTDFMVDQEPAFYMLIPQLVLLQQNILHTEQSIGQHLDTMSLHSQDLYLTEVAMRSIIATDDIEGVRTTRTMIQQAIDSAKEQGKRLREFMHLSRGISSRSIPQTLEDIRRDYDRMMAGELTAATSPDGEYFRSNPVHIMDGAQRPVHSGVHPESAIIERMSYLLEHASREDTPVLASAFAAHFMLEYTHPFYDGNGRYGRYLLAAHLSRVLSAPSVLMLSVIINEQKKAYYKAFSDSEQPRNYGELTHFILMLSNMLLQAQERVLDDLVSAQDRSEKLLASLEPALREHPKKETLIRALAEYSVYGTGEGMGLESLSELVQKNPRTVRTYLAELVQAGTVQEHKKGKQLIWSLLL